MIRNNRRSQGPKDQPVSEDGEATENKQENAEASPPPPRILELPESLIDDIVLELNVEYPHYRWRISDFAKREARFELDILQVFLISFKIGDANLKTARETIKRLRDACLEADKAISSLTNEGFDGLLLLLHEIIPSKYKRYFLIDYVGAVKKQVGDLGLIAMLVYRELPRGGRQRDKSFDRFTMLVQLIAEDLKIDIRLPSNWETKEPRGPFFRLAELLEERLHPLLKHLGFTRSQSRQALAKKLERSLRRIKAHRDKKAGD